MVQRNTGIPDVEFAFYLFLPGGGLSSSNPKAVGDFDFYFQNKAKATGTGAFGTSLNGTNVPGLRVKATYNHSLAR